ncbi:MAG TPA: alpha-L-arabinofuranosidase C-terminal domain-containing protein [Bryobacteraceae bacterium]|nr:alpha-L-arabinofuranosidase C-terminal domain-containing protein [Bryobacteraceae bacterium]
MQRRTLLRSAIAGLGVFGVSRFASAADLQLELNPEQPGPEISPHLYGHFIEHLGGVIYDGIWVGKDSRIGNVNGIRKAFVDDMKSLGAPNLRWPGGCFAEGYHWRDGLGLAAKRPRTATYWGSQMPPELHGAEPNTFGTHEFIELCRLTGAQPYLAANVASGSPAEFHDWFTYCNAPDGSATLASERRVNGSPEPFNVRFWGVGNENWNCGGMMKPAEYAAHYRRFTSQVPPYGQPFFVACGPRGHNADFGVPWTEGFFEGMQGTIGRPRIDGFSVHFYTDFRPTKVSSAESTEDEWFAVLEKGLVLEKSIAANWSAMQKYKVASRVRFVIDEWGVWYNRSPEIAPGFQLAQVVTLRDAIHTGMHFDIFNRHADKIAMANVAQTINCLHSLFLAHEDKYARTPVFYVFDLYKPHMGAKSLNVANPAATGDIRRMISASASVKDRDVTVTLTNPSVTGDRTVQLKIAGSRKPAEARARVLTHAAMNATNSLGKPEEVRLKALAVQVARDAVAVTLPARSVSAITIRLA